MCTTDPSIQDDPSFDWSIQFTMFVLYQAMSSSTRIRAPQGVWFRILGFYASREEALQSIPAREADDQGEIRITKTGEFKLLMKSTPTMFTHDYEVTKLQRLLDKNTTWFDKKAHELKLRTTNTFLETGASAPTVQETPSSTLHSDENSPLQSISSTFMNPAQQYAAIAVIPDYDYEEDKQITCQHQRYYFVQLHLDSNEAFRTEAKQNPVDVFVNSSWYTTPQFLQWYSTMETQFSLPPLPTPIPFRCVPEPAIAFLHVGCSEKDVQEWITTHGHLEYPACDIACVPLYVPGNILDMNLSPKQYSSPMLQKFLE